VPHNCRGIPGNESCKSIFFGDERGGRTGHIAEIGNLSTTEDTEKRGKAKAEMAGIAGDELYKPFRILVEGRGRAV